MTWPTTTPPTTDYDAGSDNPSAARVQLLALAQLVADIINNGTPVLTTTDQTISGLKTFSQVPAGITGRLLNFRRFDGGTLVPNASTTKMIVVLQGGGGGGGGAEQGTTSNRALGTGGGGGGCVTLFFTSIPANINVSIGSGGTRGNPALSTQPGAGQATAISWDAGATGVSANGGGAGTNGALIAATAVQGYEGGSGGAGYVAIGSPFSVCSLVSYHPGGPAEPSYSHGSTLAVAGAGGHSLLGLGSNRILATGGLSAGYDGLNYGSGGGGGFTGGVTGSAAVGGLGAIGTCLVYEFA